MLRIMNLYVPVFLYLSIVTDRLNFRRLLRVAHFTSSVTSEFTDPYTRKKVLNQGSIFSSAEVRYDILY